MKGGVEAVSIDGSWTGDGVAPLFNSREYFAMMEFLSSGWFERPWIFQEIRLSSVGSILLYDHHSIEWECFPNATCFLYQRVPWPSKAKNFDSASELQVISVSVVHS
jgi:hypothetical protein